MNAKNKHLSVKSRKILDLISKGHSYEQILLIDDAVTYFDIFDAANEALELDGKDGNDYHDRLAEIRNRHPRAYEKWTNDEEAELDRLFTADPNIERIAERLQRQPSAIRSRLRTLGLLQT
ncbi:MAG: hypothetical protein F4Y63_02605 [Chloroflexi bacterium]|nr:hypothetical protein [Chloroflexota bacterium]MYK61781.1 hypothetical protein [Chloroflexota bacterium]